MHSHPSERLAGGGFGNRGRATMTTTSNVQIEGVDADVEINFRDAVDGFEYAIDNAGKSKFESLWRKKEGNVDDDGNRIFKFHNVSAASTTSTSFVGLNSIRTALESSAAQYRRRELLPSEPQMEQDANRYSPPMSINVASSTRSVVNNSGLLSTSTNNRNPPMDGSNDDGVNPAIRAASLTALEAGTIARAKLRASMEGPSSTSTDANDTTMTGVVSVAGGGRTMTTSSSTKDNATDFFLTQDPNHAFDYDDYAGPLPSDEDVAMHPSTRHRTARVTSSPMTKGYNNRGGGFGSKNNDNEFGGEDEFETALDDDELAATLDVDNIVSQKQATANNNVDVNYYNGDSYDRAPLRTLYGGSSDGGDDGGGQYQQQHQHQYGGGANGGGGYGINGKYASSYGGGGYHTDRITSAAVGGGGGYGSTFGESFDNNFGGNNNGSGGSDHAFRRGFQNQSHCAGGANGMPNCHSHGRPCRVVTISGRQHYECSMPFGEKCSLFEFVWINDGDDGGNDGMYNSSGTSLDDNRSPMMTEPLRRKPKQSVVKVGDIGYSFRKVIDSVWSQNFQVADNTSTQRHSPLNDNTSNTVSNRKCLFDKQDDDSIACSKMDDNYEELDGTFYRRVSAIGVASSHAAMTARQDTTNNRSDSSSSDSSSSDSIIGSRSSDSIIGNGSCSSSNHYSNNSEETPADNVDDDDDQEGENQSSNTTASTMIFSLDHLFKFPKPNTNAPIFKIIDRLIVKLERKGEIWNPLGYLVKKKQLTAPTITGGALIYFLISQSKYKAGSTTNFDDRRYRYSIDEEYEGEDLGFQMLCHYDSFNHDTLDMVKQCLMDIYNSLSELFDNNVDDNNVDLARMTFTQMKAFEDKSQVSIFTYLTLHCVLKDTEVPYGGLGNTNGALRRMILLIIESGVQERLSKYIDLVGSQHEWISSRRLEWCIEMDRIVQDVELVRFSKVLASIGIYGRLRVIHTMDMDTWCPNCDDMPDDWVAVTKEIYNVLHRSKDAYGEGLVSDAVDTTPPDPNDPYNTSHYTKDDSRKALKRLVERIQSTKDFTGVASSTVPNVNYMMISVCELFYGKGSKKLFDMLKNADFVLIFQLLNMKVYHYTKKGSNQHSLIFVHGQPSNMLQSRNHNQAPINEYNLKSSSRTAIVLHFLQAVYGSFGSENPNTNFATNKSVAGNNLFAVSIYSFSTSNCHSPSQNAALIGKNILALQHRDVNHFREGHHQLPAGHLNTWKKNRGDDAKGFRDGSLSDRIVNRASIAMNESEVEDALRSIVELVTTNVVTGVKRNLSDAYNAINENKSLHKVIKTQIINILPQKLHKANKLWTKKDHDVIEQLIRKKVIKKWPDWAGMSKHLDRSRKCIGDYMSRNEEFSGKMKTLFEKMNPAKSAIVSTKKRKAARLEPSGRDDVVATSNISTRVQKKVKTQI